MRVLVAALIGGLALAFPGPGAGHAVAQVDLRPPMKPAAKPAPRKAAPAAPKKSAAEASIILPSELRTMVEELHVRVLACKSAAEPVMDVVPPEIDENGECVAAGLSQFREEAEAAAEILETCPTVEEFTAIRNSVTAAIRHLERGLAAYGSEEARTVQKRRIELLRDHPSLVSFVNDEATIKGLRAGLGEKIGTVDEVVRACGGEAGGAASGGSPRFTDLAARAAKEGALTVMALPRGWCGYGGLIDAFRERYGLKVVELDPNANSEAQVEALRRAAGGGGDAPDVVELSFFHGQAAKAAGLLQAHRVEAWDSIPAAVKDPEAHWYGDYFDVMVFAVNADLVKRMPRDWPDLASPDFRNSVALAGHPHRTNEALQAIYAAGLSAAMDDAALAGEAGLRYFADLDRLGVLSRRAGNALTLARGETPVVIRLESAARADREKLLGAARIEIVVPKTGLAAITYVQAISAYARHPNAARLWMEHLYSDEGQLAFLRANCHPVRFRDLVDRDKVPAELFAARPDPSVYDAVVFPDPEEQGRARETIFNNWGRSVGVAIN